jgi:hypothetical protein
VNKIYKSIATALLFGLVSVACIAQDDDGPAGFSYVTYHYCDVATQGSMDAVIETNEKAVFDKWVADGKLIAWGYLSHNTGGRWRRAQYHVSPTLAEAFNNQAAIFTEIYADNEAGGQARSAACAAHDDYIWALQQGSPPGTDRGDVSYSVYYVCDINGQDRADEIWAEANAPYLNQLQEEGKIASWGWQAHIVGGRYRRLQTITGADNASVVQANAGLSQYADDNHPELGEEFNDICGTHTDYLWDIVHEAP